MGHAGRHLWNAAALAGLALLANLWLRERARPPLIVERPSDPTLVQRLQQLEQQFDLLPAPAPPPPPAPPPDPALGQLRQQLQQLQQQLQQPPAPDPALDRLQQQLQELGELYQLQQQELRRLRQPEPEPPPPLRLVAPEPDLEPGPGLDPELEPEPPRPLSGAQRQWLRLLPNYRRLRFGNSDRDLIRMLAPPEVRQMRGERLPVEFWPGRQQECAVR